MPAAYQDLLVERDGRVAVVTLNRPQARNALCTNLLRELAEVIDLVDRDRGIHAIVLTGGAEVFAAGADVRELSEQRDDPTKRQERRQYWSTIHDCTRPMIAAVNGYCLGGGNELAMMCDIVVAGEGAKFGQPEIKLGLIPGAGALQRLTQALGKAQAMRLILTGDTFTASQALDWGLVSAVVPNDQTFETALELAKRIAEMPRVAVWSAMEAIREAAEDHLDFELNAARFEAVLESDDCQEGIAAFLEKRRPFYKGS